MGQEEWIACCLKKPYAFLTFPFGPETAVVKLGPPGASPRIFAQFFTLKGEPFTTFSCDRATGEFYRAVYPGVVTRGHHCPPVQQPYFNTLPLSGAVPDEEIKNMIDLAYAAVTAKYPKTIRRILESENT